MDSFFYQPLGPVSSGSRRATLGLKVVAEGHAEPVVMVWVPDPILQDAELFVRMKRETSRAMVLEHPNVVRVHGLVSMAEGTARVVDFVDGEPLRKVLNAFGGRLPLPLAARVVADACLGVNFAHEAGYDDGTPLLHGDIRPETVMVGFSGVSKVSGYGALVVAPREQENQRKLHIAPEQVLGGREAISRQTDVYLLGLLLHVCLTGRVPFEGNKDFERSVLADPLPFFSPSEIPPEVASLLERALFKRASARFENPMAMREALEKAVPLIATHQGFAAQLSRYFPEDNPERASRKKELDGGLYALVQKRWRQPKSQSVSLVAAPPASSGIYPAVALPTPDVERSSGRGWAIALLLFMAMVGGAGLTVWQKKPGIFGQIFPGAFPDEAIFTVPDAGTSSTVVEVLDVGPDQEPPVAELIEPDDGGVFEPVVAQAQEHPGLDVATDPAMDMKIDGIPIGRGRAVVNTDPGRHVLTLIEPHTQLSVIRAVYVPEGGKARLRLSIGRAFVTVNAPEGSMIFLDDRKIGFAPMRGMIPVLEGTHTMAVRVGKSKWQEEFTLKPGQKVHFDVSPD